MPESKEMVIEAIEHCKICKCDECPFRGHGSYCMAVLEYLSKMRAGNKVKGE